MKQLFPPQFLFGAFKLSFAFAVHSRRPYGRRWRSGGRRGVQTFHRLGHFSSRRLFAVALDFDLLILYAEGAVSTRRRRLSFYIVAVLTGSSRNVRIPDREVQRRRRAVGRRDRGRFQLILRGRRRRRSQKRLQTKTRKK